MPKEADVTNQKSKCCLCLDVAPDKIVAGCKAVSVAIFYSASLVLWTLQECTRIAVFQLKFL